MKEQYQSWNPIWLKANVAIGCVLAVFCIVYWETVYEISDLWSSSDTYGYGFLLLPISAYLIWRERTQLVTMIPAPELKGIAFTTLLSGGWFIGDLVDVQVVKQLSLALLIPAISWAILGWQITRHLGFPLLYPLLAVPIWSPLTAILQQTTAEASARLLDFAGVPVFLDGHYLSIPEGNFFIAEYCAGLNYLMATLAITTLYAYLNYRYFYRALLFITIGISFSIFLNWIRVVTIIMIGHLSGMQHPLIDNHLELGWGLFAVSLIPLFLIGEAIRKRQFSGGQESETYRTTGKRARFVRPEKSLVTMMIAVGVGLSLGPAMARWIASTTPTPSRVSLMLPSVSGSWSQTDKAPSDWRPKFLRADAELLAHYKKGSRRVSLYVAYYANEEQDKEVINELNTIYAQDSKAAVEVEKLTVLTSLDSVLNVWQTQLTSRDDSRILIWHWYYVDGRFVSIPYVMKLWQVWASLKRQPGAAVIAVATENSSTQQSSQEALEDFLKYLLPAVRATLQGSVM